ncbi:hypothetical protein WME79_48375 [Sorangium sp. So ce726]|uniref:hypothetical protein n=1 Tax=Sorangium sp. So ce726 TaxID=3133319 RepID=UPI003F63BA61
MPYARFTALTLAVMGGLGALGISRPSSACTFAAGGRFLSGVDGVMPLDGVIVGWVGCYTDCPESAPKLLVTDKETGEAVSGTQEEVADVTVGDVAAGERESLLAFRPTAPLVDGHTYQITLEGQHVSAGIPEIYASAAVDMDVGAIPVQSLVSVQERWHGKTSCCTVDQLPESCGPQESCVAEEMERYVTLFVIVPRGVNDGMSQYLQIVTFSSPDGEELGKKAVWHELPSQTYGVAATEYCYQITYRSLIDGTTVEKERTCVPHGDAGETAVFPADASEIAAKINECPSPPEGFEEAWCSARPAYCEVYPDRCADDDVSSCEDSGTGAGGSGGSGAGGGAATPEEPDGEHDSAGCSVSAGSAGRGASSGWTLPAFGLALSLASRARRRRDRR